MKIEVERHVHGQYTNYNIKLIGTDGEAFLSIKGVRVVDGQNGQFLSMPSKKLESGKYWNHVWASDKFQSVVLNKINELEQSQPKKPSHDAFKARQQPKIEDLDDDIPF
jgi:DNA-binding cell septation regulator SpoVG